VTVAGVEVSEWFPTVRRFVGRRPRVLLLTLRGPIRNPILTIETPRDRSGHPVRPDTVFIGSPPGHLETPLVVGSRGGCSTWSAGLGACRSRSEWPPWVGASEAGRWCESTQGIECSCRYSQQGRTYATKPGGLHALATATASALTRVDQLQSEMNQRYLAHLGAVLLAPALVAGVFGANSRISNSWVDLGCLLVAMLVTALVSYFLIARAFKRSPRDLPRTAAPYFELPASRLMPVPIASVRSDTHASCPPPTYRRPSVRSHVLDQLLAAFTVQAVTVSSRYCHICASWVSAS